MGDNPAKIGTLTADAKVISNGQHFQPGKGPSKAVIVKLPSSRRIVSSSMLHQHHGKQTGDKISNHLQIEMCLYENIGPLGQF